MRSRSEILEDLRDAIRLDPTLAADAIAIAAAELDAQRTALRVNLDETIAAYTSALADIAALRRASKRPWWNVWAKLTSRIGRRERT